MTSNYRSFLRNLPLDSELMRTFLAEHLFDAKEAQIDWTVDEPALAATLGDAIQSYPNAATRAGVIAALEQVAQLSDAAGVREMLTVCSTDTAITSAFESLESPEERALWLYVNSAAKFNEAFVARHFDEGLTRSASQRWGLPVVPGCELSEAALTQIAAVVSAFYVKRFGYGHHCKAYVVPRHVEGSLLVVLDLSDHACNRAVWIEGRLRRGPLTLSRTAMLNYHLATGRTETVAPGGAQAQQVLVNAFAEFGLKKAGSAKRITRESYRLGALADGVDIFDRDTIGVEQPRLKSISILDFDTGLRSTFEIMGRGNRASAEAVLARRFPTDKPLKRDWPIVGAVIELPFYPEEVRGGTQKKTLRLQFNRKGQANLHKFSEAERHLIETLLVEWGLVDAPKAASSAPADSSERNEAAQ